MQMALQRMNTQDMLPLSQENADAKENSISYMDVSKIDNILTEKLLSSTTIETSENNSEKE